MMPFRVFLILGVLYHVINVKFSIGQDCFKEGGYLLKNAPVKLFLKVLIISFFLPSFMVVNDFAWSASKFEKGAFSNADQIS